MSKPTANWEKVGDKFYRKIQLYTAVFDQDLELENYNVVGAPYSGAVGRYATMRPSKHTAQTRSDLSQQSTAMKTSYTPIEGLASPSRASMCTAAPAS